MQRQPKDILIDVLTPLGFHLRVSRAYWQIIIGIKHPIMAGHEKDVKAALSILKKFAAVEQILRYTCFIGLSAREDGFVL